MSNTLKHPSFLSWNRPNKPLAVTLPSTVHLTERGKGFMTIKLDEIFFFYNVQRNLIRGFASLWLEGPPQWLHTYGFNNALLSIKATEVHKLQWNVRQHNGPLTRAAKSSQLPLSTGTRITVLSTLLTLEPVCCTRNTGYLGYDDRRDEKWSPEKRAAPSESMSDKAGMGNSTRFL